MKLSVNIHILLMIFWMSSISAFAQNTREIDLQSQNSSMHEQIINAMNNADVNLLSQFFSHEVKISIQEKKSIYNKEEAKNIMLSFFKEFPPKSFQFIHHGSSQKGVKYSIAQYTHEEGKFVIYILMDNTQNFQIQTIDIGGD